MSKPVLTHAMLDEAMAADPEEIRKWLPGVLEKATIAFMEVQPYAHAYYSAEEGSKEQEEARIALEPVLFDATELLDYAAFLCFRLSFREVAVHKSSFEALLQTFKEKVEQHLKGEISVQDVLDHCDFMYENAVIPLAVPMPDDEELN
jgi:hypothetical protein